MLLCANNLGLVYTELKKYELAERYFKNASKRIRSKKAMKKTAKKRGSAK